MSERRINLATKETSLAQKQSHNYIKSHTNFDANRQQNILQKNIQKRRTAKNFSYANSNLESQQILSQKNVYLEFQKKNQKNSQEMHQNQQISDLNNDISIDQSVWQKVDELIKRIKFKKYIRTFLSLSRIRLYKHLTQNQLNQINDLSTYQQNDRNTLNEKKFVKGNRIDITLFFRSIQIPIFLPQNYILNIWQLLKIGSIAICYFAYLIAFSMKLQIEDILCLKVLQFCQLCLILDIFVTINTAIYIRGVLCLNRKEIFSYYRSTITFYYDFSSVFFTTLYYILSFCGVSQSRGLQALLLPIVFKLNDFQVIIKKIKLKFQFDRKMQNIIELINLIKNIVFISHIFACIWLIIGKVSLEYNDYPDSVSSIQNSSKDSNLNNSWIEYMNLSDSLWYIQYLYSYYFITVTMCTVGYGDIRPTNPLEISISVFLIITCCIVFGFTLNSIGEIFQDFFAKEKMIQEKRYIIANYMDKNQIDQNTRKNIFEYLEYYWKESLDENQKEENKIISQLSDNLKQELLIQSNKLILKQSKVLRENFSLEILMKCLPIIKEQKLTPGEILIRQEEGNQERSLIFVLFGELQIYNQQNYLNNSFHTKNRESISFLNSGDTFGEKSFFSGDTKSLSVKSKDFSKILKIRREDFIEVIREDKQEYEKFMYLQDKLRFSEQISYLNSKCQSCYSNLHQIDNCPSLHFIPKKMKIFGLNQISLPQQRNKEFKRTNKKHGTLENFSCNTQAFLEFLESQFEDLDLYDQRYFQYSFFKTKTKQNSVEEDDLETTKNFFEIQRSKQITHDILESPKMTAEKKKNLYKKKSGQITFQASIGGIGIPIFSNSDYSDKDYQNQNKVKYISPQQCQDIDTINQFLTSDQQPSSLIANYEQDLILSQSNDNQVNQMNQTEKILQQNRINATKRQSSKDLNMQNYERIRNKSEIQTKITQRQSQHHGQLQNYDCKSSINVYAEENAFDMLQGKFESQENYLFYFPKYNLKNVINQLNPNSSQSTKLKKVQNISFQIKDNQLIQKLNKNIHQQLKERDILSCKSITRSKGRIQSETSLEKTEKILGGGSFNLMNKNIGKNNFEKELQKINFQLNQSQQNFNQNQSVISESKQYELYEDQISIKLDNEDPQTPPQNELQIPQIEIVSIGLIKNQHYNFSNAIEPTLQTCKKINFKK